MRFLLPLVLLLAALAHAAEPVYVVTHIDLFPNGVTASVAAMKQFTEETLKEKGCVRFEILQQDGRPNHFTMVGVWKDREAFDAHDIAAYTKTLREKLQPFVGSPWDERIHAAIR